MTNRRSGVKWCLSLITAPIVLALTINILNRRCHVKRIVILQIRWTRPRQYYWRCDGLVLLAKIRSASPIWRDNAYLESYSKRKRKYWVLHRNGTFKFKITLDRQNARQKLYYCVLPHPPHFSLPSTFKAVELRIRRPPVLVLLSHVCSYIILIFCLFWLAVKFTKGRRTYEANFTVLAIRNYACLIFSFRSEVKRVGIEQFIAG